MVYVIVGSATDLPAVASSKLEEILNAIGIKFEVHVISAHRNPTALSAFCAKIRAADEMSVFIAVAGWAAALAGAIAAETHGWFPVIGVPLPGGPYSPQDSLYSMASMPPGRPVMVVPNLDNAALAAAQILTLPAPAIHRSFREYLAKITKEPKMNINLADHKEKKKE